MDFSTTLKLTSTLLLKNPVCFCGHSNASLSHVFIYYPLHLYIVQGLFFVLFSIYFEWACKDFYLLKANLGPLRILHPGMGPLV